MSAALDGLGIGGWIYARYRRRSTVSLTAMNPQSTCRLTRIACSTSSSRPSVTRLRRTIFARAFSWHFWQAYVHASNGLDSALRQLVRTASPLAVYQLGPEGDVFRAWSIWVLGIDGDAVAEITAFADSALIPVFRLPATLEFAVQTDHFRLDTDS
jgi:hypothetical protein